ncbi:MAG: hypothetical protein JNM33_06800 [Rubrivivax sp.]|nr:hypothetical protein [Rubrivivax sp.]
MRSPCRLVLLLAAAACTAAGAQTIHKCEKAGKVVYQAVPCASGASSTVKVDAGPSEEDMAVARQRAEREKNAAAAALAAAAAANAARAPAPPIMRGGLRASGDCASLAAQLAQASNRRNMALGSARQGRGVQAGSAADNDIAMRQMEVADIAGAMRARGCGG